MRVRQPEMTLVRPGEPDEYGAWTAERLDSWLNASSNREPLFVLSHHAPPEPLNRACSGVWLAPRIDASEDAVGEYSAFRVRRVGLDGDQEHGYFSFANDGVWPMCHRIHVKPIFRPDDFTTYWSVNARFADAVCEEAGDAPLVLVQDHHFALAPQLIRERRSQSRVITFWQIPWPHWQAFEICPWSRYLLEGLLGSSIIGFQTPLDCRNFVETVERCLGAHVDRYQDALMYGGRQVLVRAYPMSVKWPGSWASCSPPVEICRASIRRQLSVSPDVLLGVGVDRLDHTKGIEEKFLAIERLLECYPELRGRFVFAQIAAPDREPLRTYFELRARLRQLRDRINHRFGADGYQPIILLEERHAAPHVNLFLRAADLCYVGSLHEGMNLLAKEFVGARDDERGVLVLSMFAGAARELTDALPVNPYDIDDAASVLARALTMSADEQADRMRRLRSVVAEFSAWRWAAQVLSDAARLRRER
jgi:trehalose 6-phosphate synthase